MTYTQHVVCTGVKSHLRKAFPEANSYHFHACLRCQVLGKKRSKTTDLCRFQGFRRFSLQDCEIVVAFDDATPVTPGSRLPPICNRPCDLATLRQLQGRLAPFLLKLLQAELEHEAKPNLIRRRRDPDVRDTCDYCWTSLFSAGWMCQYCGWEVCNECLCFLPKPERQCLSRTGLYHTLPDFVPISRFAPGEVKQLILEIDVTLHNIPPSRPFTAAPSIATAMQRADSHREIISIPHNELTNDLFVYLWTRDDPYPLVVTPIPGQKLLQYPWNPQFFIDITGRTVCNAQDCETGDIVPTTVGDFYSLFGKEYDGRRVLKLKDYPSAELFQNDPTYCHLHPDLMNATAVPDYTRQDGCFNAASYFPRGNAKSDLGPKMYSALRDRKGIGSTKLHMDVAPAFNVLTHAESQGCATWQIFARKDADSLAIWMRERYKIKGHPVHQQQVYLTKNDLADLWNEIQIQPYTIHQRQNHIVLIPPGCPHQVSNQADCIKAAGDFLFPDHLEHCLRLTTEFREENLVEHPWMVDVLQVKRTVLHAYINIREQCVDLECNGLSSAAGSEDYSMVIDDVQNSQQVYCSIPSSLGQFPTLQGPDSSALSGLRDEEMTNVVSMALQDTLQSNSSSVKPVFLGGIVNQQTKAEKNRENHERKKANKIAKRGTKSNAPFRCPWCSETRPCSADILEHINCSHAFLNALSKTQVKGLKRAHQDELVAKLRDLSIP